MYIDQKEFIMSARNVQREIDVMSKSDASQVGLTLRHVLLLASFLAIFCVKTQ